MAQPAFIYPRMHSTPFWVRKLGGFDVNFRQTPFTLIVVNFLSLVVVSIQKNMYELSLYSAYLVKSCTNTMYKMHAPECRPTHSN